MSKKKPNKPATEPIITLSDIVAAGPNGMFVPDSVSGPLAEAGLVEVNPGLVQEGTGYRATRATEAGIITAQTPDAPGTNSTPSGPSMAFKIEDSVPIPAPIGRGRSGSKYPFDALAVGQSFFVPDTAEQPDAAASLASTVSGATQRYATDHATEKKTVKGKEVPKKVYSRKFALRKVDGGARVWRVEVSGVAE